MCKLSIQQQRIDDAIFNVLMKNAKFICNICKQRFEICHDKPYIVSGNVVGINFKQDIELKICESCVIDILDLNDNYL